jgi:hypothetical protein
LRFRFCGAAKRHPDRGFAERHADGSAGAADGRNQRHAGDDFQRHRDQTPPDDGRLAAGRVEQNLPARVAERRHETDRDPHQRRRGGTERWPEDDAHQRRGEQQAREHAARRGGEQHAIQHA